MSASWRSEAVRRPRWSWPALALLAVLPALVLVPVHSPALGAAAPDSVKRGKSIRVTDRGIVVRRRDPGYQRDAQRLA
jgi:hypothetical protein